MRGNNQMERVKITRGQSPSRDFTSSPLHTWEERYGKDMGTIWEGNRANHDSCHFAGTAQMQLHFDQRFFCVIGI